MGTFLAKSAFRRVSPEQVAERITAYVQRYGVTATPITVEERDAEADGPVSDERDISIFDDPPGCVVHWPDMFAAFEKLNQTISADLGCACSAVHVYDGDLWTHWLIESGRITDEFCSRPRYFHESAAEQEAEATKYRGNAAAIANAFGVETSMIAPYLVHQDDPKLVEAPKAATPGFFARLFGKRAGPMPEPELARYKAFPDDEFEMFSDWVFIDLWRRMGIRYEDVAAPTLVLRLSERYERKLP